MEKFFWADKISDRIIKDKKSKKKYVCASGITPSGTVHIGNFREVIATDLVFRAIKNKGKKVKFIYSWDDYDRFRKVPANIPEDRKKEYENYIGMPVSEVPSPFEKNKSYAEHFEDKFEKSLIKVGIKPLFIRQSIMNKKCKYAKLIKIAFDKRDDIIRILNKYREEPLSKDWMPVEIYCEKCGKDSTKIINIKGYEIEYSCECGFKNKFDFRKKGIIKLKWRVDWPARWSYEKVDFEPGGNDHSVYGSSFTTAKEIVKLYDYSAPLYTMYDFVTTKGESEKMSKSLGNVITLDEVEEIYEPDVLRFLFVGTRPNKGFQISFDNDVIKLYEDFDILERKYYEKKANSEERRAYELSVLKLKKQQPKRTSFRHLVTLVQVGKLNGLSREDKIRAKRVRNWLDKYAGEDMKFEVQEKIDNNVHLNDLQKEAMYKLKFALKNKNLNEEKLYNEFYNISKEIGIKSEEFFSAAYNVLLNKKRGPRLAGLILSIGKKKVIKILEGIK